MSCHCNDRLDLGAERYLVRGETIHTSVGCFHASLFLGTTGQTFLVEKAVAPWRKGVEDANRISQRLKAERDQWERNARELGPRWASAETISRLKAAAQAVVDQYRACREANSMSGFWSVLDDLAAELDGRAAEAPMTWGVSTDEELFHGHYATKEEALAAAASSPSPKRRRGRRLLPRPLPSHRTPRFPARASSLPSRPTRRSRAMADAKPVVVRFELEWSDGKIERLRAMDAARHYSALVGAAAFCWSQGRRLDLSDVPWEEDRVAPAPPPSTGDEGTTLLRDVVRLMPWHISGQPGQGPGHGHARPGIWDDDHGPGKAGTPCEWCALWTRIRALLAASPSPRAQTDEGRRCAIVTEPILGCPKCHRTWEVCEGVADRLATATAALRREERDPGTTLVGKVAGGELLNDGTTLVMVQVPGRLPIRMSTPATVILEGALSSPATTEDGHG
jgi:hypothetical protein